jgi:DNA replication protein DnaC
MISVEEAIRSTMARVQVDDHAEVRAAEHRRQVRAAEARRVLGRLPLFVRHPNRTELERRVSDKRLLRAAEWRWDDGNVLLIGRTDLGKSTAAAILFRLLLSRAVFLGDETWDLAPSMYWFGAERLAAARREQKLGAGEASDIVDACNARLLFLDDAGWDGDPTAASEVLDVRYERGWPTVITSGKTTGELLEKYGDAVSRRMLDAGGKRPTIIDCFQEAAR